MHSFIHSSLNFLLNLVLPRHCLGCDAPGTEFCDDCVNGLPTANEVGSGALALYDYQIPLVKNAIWRLKYKGVKAIGARLGQELHRRFVGPGRLKLPKNRTILIVPIPLGQRRFQERGFNQAAVIARAFAAMDPTRFCFAGDLLIKIKDTPTQVSIQNRAARLVNLSGAFAVTVPARAAGQNIILIDDVVTTGGTLAEAKHSLKRAGAKRVWILTAAHG